MLTCVIVFARIMVFSCIMVLAMMLACAVVLALVMVITHILVSACVMVLACGVISITIRAHNLCHNNRQLIVIAINRIRSASKNNCN